MENKLSTSPYKGTTDTYPEDMLTNNYIFDTWKSVAQRFGFEEYDTPLIEETALYIAKSGDEIASTQLYNFVDKGGREIAIRPEMTPSLARMIAAKKNDLTLPLKWFNIGKYYRYEKPQRGRRREFIQLNIDILGIPTLEAELEIFQYILAVMEEFKAPKETYEIRVNSRYLLDYLFEEILRLSEEKKAKVGRAIDNYTKLGKEAFVEYLKELELTEKQINSILEFLNSTLEDLKKIADKSDGAKQLIELFAKAEELGLTNIRFEPSIMRGLAYYTGTVIEMFDIGSKENPRALFGGGRYDDLLSMFGQEELPAFGIGWGDTTTRDYLETYGLIPETKTDTKVFLPLFDIKLYAYIQKIAKGLRTKGINTETQLTAIKFGNQLKYASKKNIPWVMIIGEDEINAKKVQLKNMETGEQNLVTLEEAIETIKS
ncbi:MAG: Histidine-tRNA ligase [candidate division WS6 bacterium GW2011_GWC1_36_11]|uniref:Histidine--tRNA ligase n=2 Tax=Candidatus Dojkabacteria TaxID=74243 RepID=A0A0G0DV29_9BACT|nr:MAG: Histidine-tRNA ligase [candidate division WS6 bacterium GW2011_GWC1_36_11]KKQ04584.1 MAG: Histidine-tRNA ligase [candidate division WS6 bacterium GW2011_WS6_36_26]KKQ12206.1 MAG: Histidine-tRNA ligase [candidate division WS6 bacterium GW2011_GWC2_36_7]